MTTLFVPFFIPTPNGDHEPFHRAILFAEIVALFTVVKFHPTYTSVPDTAIARTIPFVPLPN